MAISTRGGGTKASAMATACLLSVLEIISKATGLMTIAKDRALITSARRVNCLWENGGMISPRVESTLK